MRPFCSPALALLHLALPVAGGEIHVPADYPTLQAAIDAASPGDVIVRQANPSGGTWEQPVTIDKPLTILGDPEFHIWVRCNLEHAFTLAGPGAGRVVIGNVRLHDLDCFHPASAIAGGGFDELHVFNVVYEPHHGDSGLGHGSSSLAVSVPSLLIEGSSIRGGASSSDHCAGFLYAGSYAAVEAPASSVTILGSTITGGTSFNYCCEQCSCPGTLPAGGEGGNAVVAAEAFVDAASVVTGGTGATFIAYPLFSSAAGVACATKPDGAAFVAGAVHQLPGNIAGSGATPLGGTFTLSFDVPGPLAVLFFSPSVTATPVFLPGAGHAYLAAPVLAGPVTTGAPQSVHFAVPPMAALLGLEGGFQIFDVTLGLTAPAVGLLGP